MSEHSSPLPPEPSSEVRSPLPPEPEEEAGEAFPPEPSSEVRSPLPPEPERGGRRGVSAGAQFRVEFSAAAGIGQTSRPPAPRSADVHAGITFTSLNANRPNLTFRWVKVGTVRGGLADGGGLRTRSAPADARAGSSVLHLAVSHITPASHRWR